MSGLPARASRQHTIAPPKPSELTFGNTWVPVAVHSATPLVIGADSHTSTHGAFGCLAFGAGASEVTHVLATQQIWQRQPATLRITVAQTVIDPAGQVHRFEIHPVRKKCLLEGLDDIARTGQYLREFEGFEAAYRDERPWLYADGR